MPDDERTAPQDADTSGPRRLGDVAREVVANVLPTRYGGILYRSRTEARWAVFFDHLGINALYEPEGYDLGNGIWYLPDFLLPDLDLFVEVKGEAPEPHEIEKARRLAEGTGKLVLIVVGPPAALRGILFPEPADDLTPPPFNVSFAKCRWPFGCETFGLTKCWVGDEIEGWSFEPLPLSACKRPALCGEHDTPSGHGLEAAIEASANERFERRRP